MFFLFFLKMIYLRRKIVSKWWATKLLHVLKDGNQGAITVLQTRT